MNLTINDKELRKRVLEGTMLLKDSNGNMYQIIEYIEPEPEEE